jgi:trimethylamine--corrinoid protein Co-methyltransferase
MSEEQILKMDDASLSILEDVGVEFHDPIALEDWKKACIVRVKFCNWTGIYY